MHGKFVWYELMTTDAAAAKTFYCEVMGWTAQETPMSDKGYVIFSTAQAPVGGLMTLPAKAREQGARPGWNGYIAVTDVDAFAGRVQQAGGTVHHAAEDIPSVGRFCVASDPQDAPFVLFKGLPDQQPPQPAAGTPGHVGWHELHAKNWDRAFTFYAALFGWTKAQAVDMGALGTYQTFATGSTPLDLPNGGMMTKTEAMPKAAWLYYFNVDQVDAAVSRVKKQGGQILNEPQQVPGGSWIVQCLDPQGAMFALVGPKR